MMVLLSLLALGLLSLSTISLRSSGRAEARATAMANARLGLTLALAQLQSDLGDDRRATADASIFSTTQRPAAVGVWDGWSPRLGEVGGKAGRSGIDYTTPKGQEGFRGWLVSSADAEASRQLAWHESPPAEPAPLFTRDDAGFDLEAERIVVDHEGGLGRVAWAVAQENTKARINLGPDDETRPDPDDRLQAPSRPHLSLSGTWQHPEGDWPRRAARVTNLSQAALDEAYGISAEAVGRSGADFTAHARSVLSNPVDGGLKVDLTTGFELDDADFAADSWGEDEAAVSNPFQNGDVSAYRGQRPLWNPLTNSAEASVFMDFPPASVNHRFQVNGVPTFDTLRAHYRTYRHLYQSDRGEVAAFERPYSHVATSTRGRSRSANDSHPSLAPVLDRMNLFFSIVAKADGTLGILLTPVITLWNPHNVALETEGVVVYPWIDFAVFWNWNVRPRSGSPMTWGSSLSRFVGEGYQGHGRSARPYFYLHLTKNGEPAPRGGRALAPLRLEPGEVRVFTLAETDRRDLEIHGTPLQRTWRMRPAEGPSDLTNSLKAGIVLNMTKSIDGTNNFNYRLQNGDQINANTVHFDRGSYYYIVNMADAYHIKNPRGELMAEDRPAAGGLPSLREEPNLYLHAQIHSGTAHGTSDDSFSYPSFRYETIRENPKLVGSLLTYHRVARSGSLPICDLMFTTNPRQGMVNPYLSGADFQTGPHYETLFQGGTSLARLAMETTFEGTRAFYGPSHSAATGFSHLPFFEVPRSPLLSLGALQHCDVATTAFSTANQIGNSNASAYLAATTASSLERRTSTNQTISPDGLAVYDSSYLANEALFDGFYFSGATPVTGSPQAGTGREDIWENDQVAVTREVDEVLADFFEDPGKHPLRNPRLIPHTGGMGAGEINDRLDDPARCVRLASHLMLDGGFNVNSTRVEAWKAMLASLRGAGDDPDATLQSRFRHILSEAPVEMTENDPWTGFRSLSDEQIEALAEALVTEIKERGPFLSLGEFVNRQVTRNRTTGRSGALQAAIDRTDINDLASQTRFNPRPYPNPENIGNPDTGTNLPGWLTQADVLTSLAPCLTSRSDTFVIRSLGEARDPDGELLAQVRLEAVVQRVPEFIDPSDSPETPIDQLTSKANQRFGRRFQIVSHRVLP